MRGQIGHTYVGSDLEGLWSQQALPSSTWSLTAAVELKRENGRLATTEDDIVPNWQACFLSPQRGPWGHDPWPLRKAFLLSQLASVSCQLASQDLIESSHSVWTSSGLDSQLFCLLVFQPVTVWMALAFYSLSSAFFRSRVRQGKGTSLLVCSKSRSNYS